MSALPPIPPYPVIERIAWPLLFAGLVNWSLFGVLTVQCYIYTYNFPKDRRFLKTLVYSIFTIEVLQTVANGADLFYWFSSGFGNLKHLESPFASAIDVPIIESVVSLVVQFFFAHRIWILSDKSRKARWFCSLVCLCSIMNAAAAFTIGIYAHVNGRFPSGERLKQMATTWLVGNAAADILIASAMLYYLITRRGEPAGMFSHHGLVKIVRLTVETNLLTTSVGILSLLMVTIYPDENWYASPTSILGKLYSNTLLVSLNNRILIREGAPKVIMSTRNPPVFLATRPDSDSSSDTNHTEMKPLPAVPNLNVKSSG
ncbi:hypothetical protein BC827DRAFT_208378 [Russula dissimulans]|nr:hypothetical protein BC827DRAFT_208378 [Russula dissimulans]